MAGQANTTSITTNLNVNPYFDDFDESKNFHRILFRPGLAVQARELTQMQSILQNQIDRFAEHIFKEGSTVRGSAVNYDKDIVYVKLRNNTSTGSSVNVQSFLDKTITGSTNKVKAVVIKVNDGSEANTPNFKTLFIKYTQANNAIRTFANGEIITASGGLSANLITAAATGFSSLVKIDSGVIFAKDHFIRVAEQSVILDKYSSNSSYRIGYQIDEEIVTESSDTTLLDPASGSSNYTAPGAARFKLTATLTKKTFSDTSTNNFVEVMTIKNGVIQTKSDEPRYNQLEDYVAGRLYDQSGNFIVDGMIPRLREHKLVSNNQGVYTSALGGNTQQLVVETGPGRAYVLGYEKKLLVSDRQTIDKGIDYASTEQVTTPFDYGNYVIVDNVAGTWDINAQSTVTLRDTQANSVTTKNYSLTSAAGTSLGSARVRAITHYSGTPGLPSAQYKVYLSDVKITTAGKGFANVQSIASSSGNANGRADIVGATGSQASLTDSNYDRGVFNLPYSAIRTIRAADSTIDTDLVFTKSFNVTFNSVGSATVASGSASETFSGSGTLSSALGRSRYYVVATGSANSATLTGTIATSGSSNTITGTSTSFTTQVNPGDLLQIQGYANSHLVTEVTNNTTLKVLNAVNVGSGKGFWKIFKQGQVLDFGGNGRNGARSISVPSTTSTTLNINESLNSPTTLTATVVAQLTKVDAQEASKVVNRSRLVQISVGAGGGTSYTANTTGPWPLGLSDGFKLVSVRKKSGSNFSAVTDGSDVTADFTLDTGMRDSYYDHARLVKKSTSSLSIASGDRLLVKFDYFTHSYSTGVGYFSVDSYPVNDSTAGSDTTKIFTYEIPIYTSPSKIGSFDLRNAIDIRPRVTDTANSVTTLSNISINPLTSSSVDQPSGGLRFAYPGTDFTADLDYYLSRRDRVVLDRNGTFTAIRGTPNLVPITPDEPNDAMTVATIKIAPYPSISIDVAKTVDRYDLASKITPVRNPRYTMRDIAALQTRIENLEYYTTLNTMESATKNLEIPDSNGLNRFKNGIVVDKFAGHNIGDVRNLDYKIAIDKLTGEARPTFKLDNAELFFNSANSSSTVRTNYTVGGVSRDQTILVSNSAQLFSNGEVVTAGGTTATVRYKVNNKLYVESATGNFTAGSTVTGGTSGATSTISSVSTTTPGDTLTLPYTHEVIVNQPFATTTRNATGLFYNWQGRVVLNPDNDYWVDTTQRPDVTINQDLYSDAMARGLNQNVFGTEWGSWDTVASSRSYEDLNVGTGQIGWTSSDAFLQAAARGVTARDFAIENNGQWWGESETQDQVRAGVNRQVVPVTRTTNLGPRITDVTIQPFMRSRVINLTIVGVKPNAKLYTFFDGTNVTAYVTPTNSSFANTAAEGGTLRAGTDGRAYATFRVPSDGSLRFRTGEKKLRVTDSPTNETEAGLVTTYAEGTYASQGLNVQKENVILATRVADIQETTVTENRSVTTILDQGDPIAQSFKIDTVSVGRVDGPGCFLTKIDLYFSEKDATLDCMVQLREIDPNSFLITERALPFSTVFLSPSQINTSTDGSAPTPVYFNSPIYVQNQRDYAVVIKPVGNSPNFRLFTARLGAEDLITGNRITSQPAAGMLFASSNDRQYAPVQTEDLKFKLYAANFDKTVTGTAVFKNELRDYFTIANVSAGFTRSGEVVHGETLVIGTFANTKSVNTNVTYAQGMTSGATGTITYFSTSRIRVKNVSTTAKFKGGEKIRIRNTNATTGVIVGNSTGGVTSATYPTGKVAYYDAVTASNTYLHLANVSYTNSGPATFDRVFNANTWVRGQTNGYFARIVSLNTLKMDLLSFKSDFLQFSNTEVFFYGKFAKSSSTRDTAYSQINPNVDTFFDAPRYILSRSVESNTSASSSTMATSRSADIKAELTTTNRYLSPVIDVRRISLSTVENLINNDSTGEAGVTSGGNSLARYVIRKITLADGQDAEDLRVYLTAWWPGHANIGVYYKILHREDSNTFDQALWVPMSQITDQGFTSAYSNAQDLSDFREYVFQIDSYSNTYRSGANTTNSSIVEYRNTSRARFVGFKYFVIKVVLTSSDTVRPPRLRDFRCIALQR